MEFVQQISLIILTGTPLLASVAGRQPNVIAVMANDISGRDFPIFGSSTCYGERAATPIIDRLAREGCYLTTAWFSTVFMPMRAMVMSGRSPHLTKWWNNGEFGNVKRSGIYEVAVSSPLTIGHLAIRPWTWQVHGTT